MKKVFFALTLCVAWGSFAYAAEDLSQYKEECLSVIERPKVEVESSYGKLRYNFSKDKKTLREETERKFKENGLEMPADFQPIGLTKVQNDLKFDLGIGQIEISRGYSCLYPTDIKAFLGYYISTIYILKGLAKESCLYNLALRHEKTHMQIYIEALDYFLPQFKKTVDELFETVGVSIIARGEDGKKAAEQLNNRYNDVIQKKVELWHKEVEKEQLKLDSLENYVLENRLCEEIDGE